MSFRSKFDNFEIRLAGVMSHYGMLLLRIGMGIVFIWFGALKLVDQSPAMQLVLDSTYWIPIPHFLYVLACWEVLIGICFLYRPMLRLALLLLFLHMPGTVLPFFLIPDQCWVNFPFGLTLEGQYIVKNLVLVGAAIVIGGTLRNRTSGFARFNPEEVGRLLEIGTWHVVPSGTRLVTQGQKPEGLYFIKTGNATVSVDGVTISSLGPGQFVGEMSFLTDQVASATVHTSSDLRYLFWQNRTLQTLIREDPHISEGFYRTLSLDLIQKLNGSKSS